MKSPHRRRSLLVILVTALALVAVACGGDTKTGSGLKVEEGDGSGVLGALRDTTTTAPPQVEGGDGGGGSAGVTTPPPTNAPTTAPPTTRPAPRRTIAVLANSPFFREVNNAVQVGTIVEFVNEDSVEREVLINDGKVWRSGMIPPGGKAEYTANAPGSYSVTEGTRPYATGGQLRVQ